MRTVFPFLSGRWPLCLASAALGLAAGFLAHECRPGGSAREHAASTRKTEAGAKPGADRRKLAVSELGKKTAALAERLAISSRIERWLLLSAAVEKAGVGEMPDLLRLAAGDERAQEMIATRWAEKNPRHLWESMIAAYGMAMKGGAYQWTAFGMGYGAWAHVLFTTWVEQDAPAVRAALHHAEGVPEIRYLREQVYAALFRKDPEAALRVLDQWGGGSFSMDSGLVRDWAKKDPRHAAEVLRDCGSGTAALDAGREIGSVWGAEDPAAALAYAESRLSGSMRQSLARGAIKAWAEKDPRAALAFLATQSNAGFRGMLASEVVPALAKTDPAEALRWAEENLEGMAKRDAVLEAVARESTRDPEAARERALALPTGAIKNNAVAWLAMVRMQQSGVRPAVDWLLSLAEPEARHAGFERVAEQMYSKDPKEAAEIAAGPLAEAVPREFTENAARHYAATDPEAAMSWTETLPADRQTGARVRALEMWMQHRPLEAAEWFGRLPVGPERAGLMEVACQYVCHQPAETAGVVLARLRPEELAVIRREVERPDFPVYTWRDAAWKAEISRLLGP